MSANQVEPTVGAARARRGVGPFTGGQLTVIIVVLALVVGLPVGAFAAVSFTNVSITDPTGTNRALVDRNGAFVTRQGGVPVGAFSVSGESQTSVNTILPGCSTTTCHYAITDVVLSQVNDTNDRLTLVVSLRVPVDGQCSPTTFGNEVRSILLDASIEANTTSDVHFETPIVAGGNPLCLLFQIPPLGNDLFWSYTVSGFRQSY